MEKRFFVCGYFNNFILTTEPSIGALYLFMRAYKLISEFNPSGEDGADIGEEGDKIDSNELREAAGKEKSKGKEATKEEQKKRYIKIAAIINKVFNSSE